MTANRDDDYDAVPLRPMTDDEIEALPVINLDELLLILGPPTSTTSPTKE